MFRTVLHAAILPLEFLSLSLRSGDEPAGVTWRLLAASVAMAAPIAWHGARKLFGDDADSERSLPGIKEASRSSARRAAWLSGEA